MSRRLRGGIPRAFASHKTAEAYGYRVYVRAKLERHPTLGLDAMPTLREAGLVNLELLRLGQELQARRLTRRERSRLRRQAVILRNQLVQLEKRLEELAGRNGHGVPSLRDYLADRYGTGQEPA